MKKFAFRGSASSGADDMEYKYDLNEKALYIEENRIPAYSMEKN